MCIDHRGARLPERGLVAAGNRAVFEPDHAYIENVHTGQRLDMTQNGGMYTLKMWVKADSRTAGIRSF